MTTGRINQISVIFYSTRLPFKMGSRVSRQYIYIYINKPKFGLLLLQTNSSNCKFIDVMALRRSVSPITRLRRIASER